MNFYDLTLFCSSRKKQQLILLAFVVFGASTGLHAIQLLENLLLGAEKSLDFVSVVLSVKNNKSRHLRFKE